MINRKTPVSSPKLCKNCIRREYLDGTFVFPKDEWICRGSEIVDFLDGEVTYHTCRKARKDEKLCGPDGQWFKAKP